MIRSREWYDEVTEEECRICGRMLLSRGEALSGRCASCMEKYIKKAHEGRHQDRLRKPKWDCPKCLGSGWEEIDDGGVGSARPCRCSVPTDESQVEYWLDRAGVPPAYLWKTMDGWTGGFPSGVVEFLADPSRQPFLFISGLQGRGKTHLATAIFRELLAMGKRGHWRDVKKWASTLRSAVASKGPEYSFETLGLRTAEVLLLDDLGRERTTDFVEDEVELLLRERHASGLITLITSQWSIEQLAQEAPMGRGFSPDVCSRISEGRRIELDGPDRRRS